MGRIEALVVLGGQQAAGEVPEGLVDIVPWEDLKRLKILQEAGAITPAQRALRLRELWPWCRRTRMARRILEAHVETAEAAERKRRLLQVDEHRPHTWGGVERSLTLSDGDPDPQGSALSMLTCGFTFPAESPTRLVVSAGPRERMMLRAETLRERLLALGAHPESTVLIHPKEALSVGRNL